MQNEQTIQAAIKASKEGDKGPLAKLLEEAFTFKDRKILNITDIKSLLSKPEIISYLNDPSFKEALDEIIQSAFQRVVFRSGDENEKQECIELIKLFFQTPDIKKHIIDINNVRIRATDKDGKPIFKKGSPLFMEALGCLEIADILVENGTDVNACGSDGHSAFTSLTMDFAKAEAAAKREAYEIGRAKAKDQAKDAYLLSSLKQDPQFKSLESAKQAQMLAAYRAEIARRVYSDPVAQEDFAAKKSRTIDFIKLLISKYKIDPLKLDEAGDNIASIDAQLKSTELKKLFKAAINKALKEEQDKLVMASKTVNAEKAIQDALTRAVKDNNDPEMLKFILTNENTKHHAQAFLNQQDGVFAGVVGFGKEKFELAKILMENGADPYDGRRGKSALVQAVEENNVEALRFLVRDLGLDPYKLDKNGDNVIKAMNNKRRSRAFSKKQEEHIELLNEVASYIDPEKEKIRLVDLAKAGRREEVREEFLEVLEKRDIPTIRFLLSNPETKRYIDLNAPRDGFPLVVIAIAQGDFELATLFIEKGAKIEDPFSVTGGGMTQSCLTFVASWNISSPKESAHQIECIKFLVNTLGLDPYKADGGGKTAISLAKENGNKELLAFLKPFMTPEKEINRLKAMTIDTAEAAFKAAVVQGDLETVNQMLAIKAIKEWIVPKLNEMNDGSPLLMRAFEKECKENNKEIARILVANGADPYISEAYGLGSSLLTHAAYEKNSGLVKFLTDKKAEGGLELDPYRADRRGRTTVSIAKQEKDNNLLTILQPFMTEKDQKEEKAKQYCVAIKTYVEALDPVIKELQEKMQKASPTLKMLNLKDSIRLDMAESLKKYLSGIDNLEHPKKPPEKIKQELLEIEKHIAVIGKKPGNDNLAKAYALISNGIQELLEVSKPKEAMGQRQKR